VEAALDSSCRDENEKVPPNPQGVPFKEIGPFHPSA